MGGAVACAFERRAAVLPGERVSGKNCAEALLGSAKMLLMTRFVKPVWQCRNGGVALQFLPLTPTLSPHN
jgi:hypothetical protein